MGIFDGAIHVWRDDVHKSKFWARVYMNGRVDWIQGGFKSIKAAMTAAKKRNESYY